MAFIQSIMVISCNHDQTISAKVAYFLPVCDNLHRGHFRYTRRQTQELHCAMAVIILQRDNDCISPGAWSGAGTPPPDRFCHPHRDVALNQLLELTLKDTHLRAHTSCPERARPADPAGRHQDPTATD